MDIPKILPCNNTATGAEFVEWHKFTNGTKVPVYDISTTGAFNQLVGYAKFLNHNYGNVYYRGTDDLYYTVLPSIMRERVNGTVADLHSVLSACESHPYLSRSLQLFDIPRKTRANSIEVNRLRQVNKSIIEGMIQHYAGNTRFVDVVNNHWIALWMGLHKFPRCGEGGLHIDCQKRVMSVESITEHLNKILPSDKDSLSNRSNILYEYIILLAMPDMKSDSLRGVRMNPMFIEVDLRKSLPSFFLRPHAQHALVVRKRQPHAGENTADYYDLSSQCIGILRVRIDRADRWLGNGELVTKFNLFPSPSIDMGYNSLLKNEIFCDLKYNHKFEIKRYF